MGQRSCTGLLAALNRALKWGNRHAGLLFIFGLLGVGFHQWRLWQADKRRLALITLPPPRPDLEDWPRLPLVSVLVAAWNEAEHIQAHIESFQALRYPHKQLVLVAGGADDTLAIARQQAALDVLVLEQQPGEGKQRALRKGFAATTGEIIYLTDADCLLDDDSFERLIIKLIDDCYNVVTGISQPLETQVSNPFVRQQWAADFYSENQHSSSTSPGILGRNCAIKKTLLKNCWEGAEEVPTGTDYYLALKVRTKGEVIGWIRTSSIETLYYSQSGSYVRQRTRWLKNLLFLGMKYGDKTQIKGALAGVLSGLMTISSPIFLFGGMLSKFVLVLFYLNLLLNHLRYSELLFAKKNIHAQQSLSAVVKLIFSDAIARSRTAFIILRRKGRESW